MSQKNFSGITSKRKQFIILLMMSIINVGLIGSVVWYVFQTGSTGQFLIAPFHAKETQIITNETSSIISQPAKPVLLSDILPIKTFTTATLYPTYTFTPSPIPQTGLAPSSTPNPISTMPPTATPMLNIGNPTIIGYSVLGKPLRIFTFGSGSNERMMIAGIHGGNEYNTILLANKLIRYLSEHPENIPPGVKLYVLP